MKKRAMIIICSLMLMCGGIAQASDWNFYGSARMETFVTDTDQAGGPDTKSLSNSLQGNSRIGAKVKVSDELTAGFEYGTGVNVRKLFGEWDFGPGKLLVGQTYTPLEIALSNQVYGSDENLNSYGNPYAGRHPMIRLSFGGFQVAAVSPKSDDLGIAGAVIENSLPALEASYRLDMEEGFLKVIAGYNSYELTDPATGVSHDVDSYIAGIGGKAYLGQAYLGADVYVAQNTGPYGLACAAADMPVVSGTNLYDNDVLGYILVAGMKINDRVTCEAGYGYVEAEPDMPGAREDDSESYYLNASVFLADGVFIVPEVGIIDNNQDSSGADESEILYYGVKWQINF